MQFLQDTLYKKQWDCLVSIHNRNEVFPQHTFVLHRVSYIKLYRMRFIYLILQYVFSIYIYIYIISNQTRGMHFLIQDLLYRQNRTFLHFRHPIATKCYHSLHFCYIGCPIYNKTIACIFDIGYAIYKKHSMQFLYPL